MKKYNSPEMSVIYSSGEGIMEGSDTFIDVGGLWPDENNITE